MVHLRLNVRIIAAADFGPVLCDERLRETAVLVAGRPAPDADLFIVAIENLTPTESEALAKAAKDVGAGVSVQAHPDTVRRVLIGSRHQLQTLASRLAEDGADAADVAREVARALDGYARTRFEVRAGPRRLEIGPQPAIMGIVNVTPDSFSDGGQCLASTDAVDHARRLVDEGADLIDIGGESTRPGSDPVPEAEELERVLPVVETLASHLDVPISIDTRRARVAREAVAAGACIINDVTGLQGDPEMAGAAAETGAGVVIMHMLGEPKTMQQAPHYDHLMADICRYLRRGMQVAADAGVPQDRLIVDPGIGFGKTLEHNLQIVARLGQLRTLGRPILVGPSRKRFIGELTGVESPSERVVGTAAACALAVAAGALVLRVHDVREVRHALAVAAATVQVGGTAS